MKPAIPFGVALLALAAAMAGPAAAGEPTTATLRLKGYTTGFFDPNWNSYELFDNDRCEKHSTHLTGIGFAFGSGKEGKPVQVAAGTPIFLRAVMRTSESVGDARQYVYCVNLVGFSPIAGHTYELGQTGAGRKCSVQLVDTATTAPPPDLQTPPTRWSCKVSE